MKPVIKHIGPFELDKFKEALVLGEVFDFVVVQIWRVVPFRKVVLTVLVVLVCSCISSHALRALATYSSDQSCLANPRSTTDVEVEKTLSFLYFEFWRCRYFRLFDVCGNDRVYT